MSSHTISPSLADFRRLARKGNMIPVFTDVMADQLTPVSLLASRWDKSAHCFLLESVEGGEKLGRYSIVSFEPEAILKGTNNEAVFTTPNGKEFMRFDEPVLNALQRYMKCVKPVSVPGVPRFFGGAVGYCSYEIVHSMENIPQKNPDVLGWPMSQFLITGDLFVFDNTQQLLKLITCTRIRNKSDVDAAYRRAVKQINQNLKILREARGKAFGSNKKVSSKPASEFTSNVNRASFMEGVRKAKEYIGKGDIIQVVLSRRNEKKTTASPLDIYRSLRVVNPSPYMFLVKYGNRAMIGSSPESLVRLDQGIVTTRPIAGTRRRGETVEQDLKLEKELLQDPKELAEHMMLVDLGRNDLGRVCIPGTVRVPLFKTVERYSHVMHIVSEVMGKIKPSKDCFDLLKAVFPAGTVSGAPKIRAMEIIDELEDCQRGPYSGAVGYISYSGNMDMAITIRTILWDNGHVSVQTGAGLVADSVPSKEFDETENKARALKETIRLAESRRLFLETV
jgi:anthranilate synthase component I